MDAIFTVNWQEIFIPNVSIAETIIRGSLVYLFLFFLLRVVLKREAGNVGVTDLLVVVLLADASQNAMAVDYKSITNCIILVTTIIAWSYILNWFGYRFPRFQRFINPPALTLVKNGRILYRNMRKELITEDELMSQLRQQGISSVSDVKAAYMEGDGHISVIPYDSSKKNNSNQKNNRVV